MSFTFRYIAGPRPLRSRNRLLHRLLATGAIVTAASASALGMAAAPASADQYGLKIDNMQTGFMADIGGTALSGGQAYLWPSNRSRTQLWDLLANGDGTFQLRSESTGRCLQANWRRYSGGNGTPVVEDYCGPGWASQWYIEGVSDWHCTPGYSPGFHPGVPQPPGGTCWSDGTRYPNLVNRWTNRCLDAGNAYYPKKPAVHANLQLWDCVELTSAPNWVNQEFSLDPSID